MHVKLFSKARSLDFGLCLHLCPYLRVQETQTVETLIRRCVLRLPDLGLHCLTMSHEKGARLIWIKVLTI